MSTLWTPRFDHAFVVLCVADLIDGVEETLNNNFILSLVRKSLILDTTASLYESRVVEPETVRFSFFVVVKPELVAVIGVLLDGGLAGP
jgi:hypothetical protein